MNRLPGKHLTSRARLPLLRVTAEWDSHLLQLPIVVNFVILLQSDCSQVEHKNVAMYTCYPILKKTTKFNVYLSYSLVFNYT